MKYRTGINAVRALCSGVPRFVEAIQASADFDRDAFAAFARRGNVREWLTPVASDAAARALLPAAFVKDLEALRDEQATLKGALLELSTAARDALAQAGVPVLFMKGLFLGQRFYGDIHRRHQYDIDVLVHGPDFERAVAVLGSLGFDLENERVARRLRKFRARRVDRAPQTVTLRRADGLEIDLHWRTKSRRFAGLDEAVFWTDRQPFQVEGRTFDTLSDRHTLLLLSLSLCLDLRRGAARVKHFLDIYLILRALDADTEWRSYLARRQAAGLLEPVATIWTMLLLLWRCAHEFPALTRALEHHAQAVRLRDPEEALRLVERPRGSCANRAWFLAVERSRSPGALRRTIVPYGPHLLLRALRPRRQDAGWPWEQEA